MNRLAYFEWPAKKHGLFLASVLFPIHHVCVSCHILFNNVCYTPIICLLYYTIHKYRIMQDTLWFHGDRIHHNENNDYKCTKACEHKRILLVKSMFVKCGVNQDSIYLHISITVRPGSTSQYLHNPDLKWEIFPCDKALGPGKWPKLPAPSPSYMTQTWHSLKKRCKLQLLIVF